MAKIMLVEDDNNLREIYEARLLAEGYEIVTAKDGEEGLALAVKEQPDLIIADVMMPKISGFDMLDILRSTAETKNAKVIMMTALSQAEDKARADKLGADRYLVKSQVTLEDVAKTAREVLESVPATPAGAAPTPAAPTSPAAAPAPPAEPAVTPAVAPTPGATPISVVTEPTTIPVATPPDDPPAGPTAAASQTSATDLAKPAAQEQQEVSQQMTQTDPTPAKTMVEPPSSSQVELPSSHEKIIQPPPASAEKPSLSELLAREAAAESGTPQPDQPPAAPPHVPGQVIGPNQTPGTDPNNPHDTTL